MVSGFSLQVLDSPDETSRKPAAAFNSQHSSPSLFSPPHPPARLINAALPEHAFRGEPAPAIESDPEGQHFAHRMQQGAPPGSAETQGQHDAHEINHENLRHHQR